MKVIGAKSLVQIAPSVTEVGERPSPGVFDFNRGGPPSISCDGSLNITDPIIINGDWKLEVDGELVRPEATSIDDVIAYLVEAGFEVTIEDVPPVISCEGADNYTEVHFFKEIGSDEISPPIVKIDGVVINAPPAWLTFSEVAAVPPPEGFEFDGSIKYTNTDSINHRIEMDQQSASKRLVLINPSNTVVEFEEYKHYGVCLSPAEIVEPPWDIEYTVNGQTYRELTGNPIPANYAKNRQREQADNGVSIFDWITGMTSLKINTTITDIGDSAFFECMQVADLQLPPTLKTVGNSSFYNLKKLKNLEIPNSVTTIGTHAFYGLEEATSIELSNSLTLVPQFAFDRAFKAQPTLIIPDSVTVIEEYAFREWKLTTQIIIGSGIQEIKENAFYGVGDYSNTLSQITVKAMVPPIIAPGTIPANECPIYVPAAVVNTYKTAAGWADFAPRIQPII